MVRARTDGGAPHRRVGERSQRHQLPGGVIHHYVELDPSLDPVLNALAHRIDTDDPDVLAAFDGRSLTEMLTEDPEVIENLVSGRHNPADRTTEGDVQ